MHGKYILLIVSLYSFVFTSSADENCDGYIAPIKWGWKSSAYGDRTDPFTGKPAFHNGIDLATKATEKAYASQSGVVVFAGEQGQHGNRIEIEHYNAHITTYSHLGSIAVKEGEQVTKGQTLGNVAPTSGRSTGPHVGFELIIDGEKVNPEDYLPPARSCSHLYLVK